MKRCIVGMAVACALLLSGTAAHADPLLVTGGSFTDGVSTGFWTLIGDGFSLSAGTEGGVGGLFSSCDPCGWEPAPKALQFSVLATGGPFLGGRPGTFNGVSYPVQRAAAAIYSPEGKQQIRDMIAFYLTNAKLIREGLQRVGIEVHGGVNAPYVWLKTPNNLSSWDFFDLLISKAHLVGTPGSGFGAAGEGYFRLSAFNSREKVLEAVERFEKVLA